ncbi:hypothetical protein Tco_0994005 [Tanacetum coccineum]
MLEFYHSATSASYTTTVRVPLDVETARRLATKQETVRPLLRWHAMDVEEKDTPRDLEYEAVKERRLWDDVRSRRRTTHYDEADFSTSRRNKSNTFYYPYSHDVPPPPVQSYPTNYLVYTEIMDDLFRIWDENSKRMEQDIDQDNVERVRQFLTPNVPDVIDNIQPLILITIHTTPPGEDYVAPATKSILDDILEEFGDEILNGTMVDKGVECSPSKDLEEL